MKPVRMLAMSLVVVGLVGCAALPKPEMPEMEYKRAAAQWVAVHVCHDNGYMDKDTAALGKQFVSTGITSYSVNQERLTRDIEFAESIKNQITRAMCNEFTLTILAERNRLAVQNSNAIQQQQTIQNFINSTKPTQTYCNRIGNQTFCNSY